MGVAHPMGARDEVGGDSSRGGVLSPVVVPKLACYISCIVCLIMWCMTCPRYVVHGGYDAMHGLICAASKCAPVVLGMRCCGSDCARGASRFAGVHLGAPHAARQASLGPVARGRLRAASRRAQDRTARVALYASCRASSGFGSACLVM